MSDFARGTFGEGSAEMPPASLRPGAGILYWRCLQPLIALALVFFWSAPAQSARNLESEYQKARSGFDSLLKDGNRKQYRHNWLKCTEAFQSVYAAEPEGSRADDALYCLGRVYSEMYKVSSRPEDRREALDYFHRLLRRFPRTSFAKKTRAEIDWLEGAKKMSAKASKSLAEPVETGDEKENALAVREVIKEMNSGYSAPNGTRAAVTDLRFWSNRDYTRIVVDVEEEVSYEHHLLKKDPTIGKPQRLYIDVNGARMGANLKPILPIGDDLLASARAGQYTHDTVRVVLDIKSIKTFNVFTLKNPFRIVLDVNGVSGDAGPTARLKDDLDKVGMGLPEGALARQLALGIRRVVIDPGHGGKDPGALGYYKGVTEKDVALQIAKRLCVKVRQELGLDAVMTRDTDVFLSLEERTAIANTKNADLFVSIHTNASTSHRVQGVETYFLNLATDNDAILVAARENATSAKNISDLQAILNDLMKNAKVQESSRLATRVQQVLARRLPAKYSGMRDMGVKQAPFYVLLGAEMPAILVETGFITNPQGCRQLTSPAFQDDVIDAIIEGIRSYVEQNTPGTLTWAGERGEAVN